MDAIYRAPTVRRSSAMFRFLWVIGMAETRWEAKQ